MLHVRAVTGITPSDGLHRKKTNERIQEEKIRELKPHNISQDQKIKAELVHVVHCKLGEKDELANRIAREAILAKIFSSISTIKASYAQLQFAQSPYDAETIQSSDKMVVSELKTLSEVKQCFLKKQLNPLPEKGLLVYDLQEKKLEYEVKLKESEITFLKEKLEECKKENRVIEKRLNASGSLSGLSCNHFIPVLRLTVRSIRCFVKLLVSEMQSAGWNLDSAANVIHPGVSYWKQEHRCFTFESFVSKEMLDSFHIPK